MKKYGKAIFCVGAGGVGKTSVLNLVQAWAQKLPEPTLKVGIVPSVARKFMTANDLTEKDVLEFEYRDRILFQKQLLMTYVENAVSMLQQDYDALIFDRSIFCHFSYTLYSCLADSEPAERQVKRTEIKDLVDSVLHAARTLHYLAHTTYVKFPVDAPWMPEQKDGDHVRWAPPAKNFVIHSIQQEIMNQVLSRISPPPYPCRVFDAGTDTTPEQRAQNIINVIKGSHVWINS